MQVVLTFLFGMATHTYTRSRTFQYVGILLALGLIAVSYWYFAVRAGVRVNTNAGPEVGDGGLGAGLVGYWKLDEGTGTSAADASVNAITALTLTNGPLWTTGRIGSGIDFDGTNDYATTADTATLDFADGEVFTVTGWFNRDTFTTADQVFAKQANSFDAGYGMYIDTTDQIYFTVYDGTDLYSLETASGLIIATGWHHFAAVWGDTTAALYVDGVLVSTTPAGTIGNIGSLANANPFRIGASADGSQPFDGKIDEIRVYDRVLSPSEITDLYQLTVPTAVDTGLVGYWAFGADDFRSTLVSDRSGGRNTGTLVNAPTKTVGKIGQALNFASASTQYVNAGSNAIVDDIVNLSTCAWVRPSPSLTVYGDVVTKYTNGGGGWQMLLDYNSFTALLPSFYHTFTGAPGHWFATTVLPYSQWSHLCVTYNNSSTTNDPSFYVNGVLVPTYENQTPTGSASTEAAGDMYIGAYNNAGSPGELFDGVIDEARVYNRIITASEVKALYDAGSADRVNTGAAQAAGTGNPDSGLVGYWKLDEGSGTSAADSSTNAITAGTLTNGPTWVTGQIGSAVDFDGTNDYITVADNSLLDFGDTDDFTISGWFNRDTFTSVEEMVVKYDGVNPGYHVYITDTAGGSSLQAQLFDGTDTYSLSGTTAFTAAGWHHFALVWDQDSAANTELYVDGRPETATDGGTIGNIGTLANANALTFGDRPGYGQPHDGKLDEIRIYDRALSAAEIANLARLNSPTGVDTGLKGYWSFNSQDMTSTLAYDRSGARNTGTLSGPVRGIGRVGQALNFDGTNDYVDNSNSAVLKPTNFTLSTWTYADTGDATTYRLIFNPSYSDSGWDNGWSLSQADDTATSGPYVVRWGDGTNPSAGTITGSTNIVGGWHHAVVTFDGTTMSLYVDGVLENSANASTLAYSGTNLNSYTGGGGSGGLGLNYFDGRIDETRLYSRALSTAEVKALYDIGTPDKTNTSVSTPQGTGRLDSGLAGYWKLDETTGSSASDSSTNGNAGTLTNMENGDWTTGRIGNGLTFDATNEYVDMGDLTIVDGVTELTVSAWAKSSSLTTERSMVTKSSCNGLADSGTFQLGAGSTTNYAEFVIYPSGGAPASYYVVTASTAMNDGNWHLVTGVYNGADIRIYMDGVLSATTTAAAGDLSANTRSIQIGACSGGFLWDNMIDEVRIYDRALSDDEIRQIYQMTVPTGTDTGLIGYWSFNGQDMTGTTARDRSGAGNTGTLTNSPTKVIGKLGQALQFDGTDDYVNVGSATIIDNLTNLSACAWVNPDTIPNGYSSIIAQMDNGGAEATFGFHDNGAGDLIEYYRSFSTNIGVWNSDRDIVPLGAWSHVCVTYNDSSVANDPVFYLNGAQIGVIETDTPVGTASSTAGGDYYIGALDNGGTGDEFFDGKIDEVRLYNRILTAAEIKALYNSGR